MKRARSSETVKLRRELAQLLRRLRAIRREKLDEKELAARIAGALNQAGSISRFIAVRAHREDAGSAVPYVDHGKLDAAEAAYDAAAGLGQLADRCA